MPEKTITLTFTDVSSANCALDIFQMLTNNRRPLRESEKEVLTDSLKDATVTSISGFSFELKKS